MADKKALLIKTLNHEDAAHPHLDGDDAMVIIKPAQVMEKAENHFRVETTRPGKKGNPPDLLVAEYVVLTDKEAALEEWGFTKGGLATSDKNYKVYRII